MGGMSICTMWGAAQRGRVAGQCGWAAHRGQAAYTMRGGDAWIRAGDAWEGARMWERAGKGGSDPLLGLEMCESGLGMHGLQGEGADVAWDVWVVDETCVVMGVIAAPAVLAAGASPVCNSQVAVWVARTKSR